MAGGKAASTYYAVLGVARDASAAEIRAAWRRLSLKWHPDKMKRVEDGARLKERALARYLEIQEAYKALSDPARKAMYDAGLLMQQQFDKEAGRGPNMDQLSAMMDRMKTHSEESTNGRPAAGGAMMSGKKKGSSSSSSSSSPGTVRIDLSIKFTPAAAPPRRPAARPRKTMMLDPVLGRQLRGRKD